MSCDGHVTGLLPDFGFAGNDGEIIKLVDSSSAAELIFEVAIN